MDATQTPSLRKFRLGLFGVWLGLWNPTSSPGAEAAKESGTPPCRAPVTIEEITVDLAVARMDSGWDPVKSPLQTEEKWERAKPHIEDVRKTLDVTVGKGKGRIFGVAAIIPHLIAAPKDEFEGLAREYEAAMRAGKTILRTPAEGMAILGALYRMRGYDKEAAGIYETEVRRCTAAKDQAGVARVRDGQGMLLAAQGDPEGAERLFLQSLAFREKSDSPQVPHSWLLLAGLHALRGDVAASDEDRRNATRTLSQGRWTSPFPGGLGGGGELRGRCVEAIGVLFGFAWQFQSRGDYASADRLMTLTLAVADGWFVRDDLWAIRLRKLAAISAFAAGRTGAACEWSREAREASVRTIAPITWRLSYERAADFASFTSSISEDFITGRADPETFAQGVLDRKGVALNQALAKQHAIHVAGGPSPVGQLAGQITQNRVAFRKQVLMDHNSKKPPEVDRLEASLAEAIGLPDAARRPTVAQLTAALPPGAAYVDYTIGDQWTENTRAITGWSAAVMQPGSPVAVAQCGSARLVREQIAAYRKLASDPGLSRGQPEALEASSRALYQSLVAPVERLLGPSTTVVYVCLDGPLAFVGLNALLDGEGHFWCERRDVRFVVGGPALLTQEASVAAASHLVGLLGDPAYASDTPGKTILKKRDAVQEALDLIPEEARRHLSPKDLAQMRRALDQAKPAVDRALAQINGEGTAKQSGKVVLPALPGTRQEVLRLTGIFQAAGWRVQSWLGAEAREENVMQVRRPAILHFATHGMFLDRLPSRNALVASAFDRNPSDRAGIVQRQDVLEAKGGLSQSDISPMYRSFLALAGAETSLNLWRTGESPTPASDGILMADEILDLDLSQTMLVTLSSCESGLGESVRGEGSVGMQRALLTAGARNVLSTLWPIADEETVEFMEAFYRQVAAGEKPSAAISSVQKSLLVQRRDKEGLGPAINLTAPFVVTSVGW